MKAFLLPLFLGAFSTLNAQIDEVPAAPGDSNLASAPVVCFCSIEASFPGGSRYLQEYITNNFQMPNSITFYRHDENYRTYVEFTVCDNGEITDIEILRGFSPEVDREVIRLVSHMPVWIPADHGGKGPHDSRVRMPVSLEIQ